MSSPQEFLNNLSLGNFADMFREIDVNRDCSINREELQQYFEKLKYHNPRLAAMGVFEKLDYDGDSEITLIELRRYAMSGIKQ